MGELLIANRTDDDIFCSVRHMIQCYGTMIIFHTLPSDFFMSVVHAAAACPDTARDKCSTVLVVFYFAWLQKCAEVNCDAGASAALGTGFVVGFLCLRFVFSTRCLISAFLIAAVLSFGVHVHIIHSGCFVQML